MSVDSGKITRRIYHVPGIESIGPAVCAIGAFDGVHLGHRYLIESMIEDARKRGVSSVIVTFDIDPDELFLPHERIRKLLSNQDRLEKLSGLGADYLYVLPFTHEFASTSTTRFLRDYLTTFMELRCIHVGYDFRFGAGKDGDVASLRLWGANRGCECKGYELLVLGDEPVTATRIRNLITQGEVARAGRLLGYTPYVTGIVEHGRGEGGKKFNIPTANVVYDTPYVPVKDGVYAGYVGFDGVDHPAAINVGIPPTFADRSVYCLEPHILDFEGNLYGRTVSVSFVERLRDLQVFTSTEELERVIGGNIQWVRENLM